MLVSPFAELQNNETISAITIKPISLTSVITPYPKEVIIFEKDLLDLAAIHLCQFDNKLGKLFSSGHKFCDFFENFKITKHFK